jgi:hypothetical protein
VRDYLRVTTLGTSSVRVGIGISSAEFNAAGLTVGSEYVVFYGVSPADGSGCVVGGIRGVFAFDAMSGTVTRIDRSANSIIPVTESLSQLRVALSAAEQATAGQPQANAPPVCDSSATGISNVALSHDGAS